MSAPTIDERWLPVVGYKGFYEVSDQGRVRSLDRVITHGGHPCKRPGRVLTACWKGPMRYVAVQLSRDGTSRQVYVHQLVLESFSGPRPFAEAVSRHLNGDHRDNRAENLAWGTQQENVADKYRHGTDHNTNKTHCKWGHRFEGDNLIISAKGHRFCRACRVRRNNNRKVLAA